MTVDNTTRTATRAGVPVLSWTSVKLPDPVQLGSSFSFVGSDVGEYLSVAGTTWDLASHSTIATGGGDDTLRWSIPPGLRGRR